MSGMPGRSRYLALQQRDRRYWIEDDLDEAHARLPEEPGWIYEITYRVHNGGDGYEVLPQSRLLECVNGATTDRFPASWGGKRLPAPRDPNRELDVGGALQRAREALDRARAARA